MSVQFGALRTTELLDLLQDEDKVNHIIRCSEKFQGLQRAVEKMLVSNQKLAKVGLSQKPTFRDAKLLLAMKYEELEKLGSIIRAKQEQLAEIYSLHYAQWRLLKKINHAEEECELLFEGFVEGKTPLADFMDSFLSSRKLQHIRMFLLKKLQQRIELKSILRLSEIQADTLHFSAGFPEQIHDACSLTADGVFPACCHPCRSLQHLPLRHDFNATLHAGRGAKWPTRPVRLRPLKVQQSRHQQAPQ